MFNMDSSNSYGMRFDMKRKNETEKIITPDYGSENPYNGTLANQSNNNPYTKVGNLTEALHRAGQDVPERIGHGIVNGLSTTLDFLNRPGDGFRGMIKEATNGDNDNIGQKIADVLQHGFNGTFGYGSSREHTSTTDLFDQWGYKAETGYDGKALPWNKSIKNTARNVLGFVGDVLLDPTTYLTGGASVVGKSDKAITAAEKIMSPELRKALEQTLVHIPDGGKTLTFPEKLHAAIAFKEGAPITADTMGTLGKTINKQDITKFSDLMKHDLTQAKNELGYAKFKPATDELSSGELAFSGTTGVRKKLEQELADAGTPIKGLGAFGRIEKAASPDTMIDITTALKDINRAHISKTALYKSDNVYQAMRDLGNDHKTALYVAKDSKIAKLTESIVPALDAAPEEIARYNKTLSQLRNLSYDALEATDATVKAFGTQIVNISDAATLGKHFTNKSVADKLMDYLDVANADIMAKRAVDSAITNVEFANGLSKIYDKAANTMTMRFMGKEFLNLSDTVLNPAAMTVEKLLSVLPEQASDYVDKLGKMFNTQSISRKAIRDNPKLAPQIASLRDMASSVIANEAGIPKEAMQDVVDTLQKEVLKDPEVDRALTYFIESEINDGGHKVYGMSFARKKYNELSKNFTPEQIELVEKGAQRYSMFMQSIKDLETSYGMKLGDDLEATSDEVRAAVLKKYPDATESEIKDLSEKYVHENSLDGRYVRHYYDKSMSKMEQDSYFRAIPDKQKAEMKYSTHGQFEKDRKFKSLAAAEYYTSKKDLAGEVIPGTSRLKPVDRLSEVLARRVMESKQILLNKQFSDFIDGFARDIPRDNGQLDLIVKVPNQRGKGFLAPEGYVELPHSFVGSDRLHKNEFGEPGYKYFSHPEAMAQFSRIKELFGTDEGVKSAAQWYDSVMNAIKSAQTRLSIPFFLRNAVGENMMNFMDGVKPESYAKAIEIMGELGKHNYTKVGDRYIHTKDGVSEIVTDLEKRMHKDSSGVVREHYYAKDGKGNYLDETGAVQADQANPMALPNKYGLYQDIANKHLNERGIKTFEVSGKQMSATDAFKMFLDLGLGWSGITKGDIITNLDKTLVKETGALGSFGSNPLTLPIRALREAGDQTETLARFSHFLDKMNEGFSPAEAAMRVKEFHVDYRDLTQFERGTMRRMMPYYTYMRKNFPIQVRNLIQNPGWMHAIGALVDSSYKALGVDKNSEGVPDYYKEGLALPIGIDDNGNITYFNWQLPITDLARVQSSVKENFNKNFLSMLTPILKVPMELGTNTNFNLGTPISQYDGQSTPLLPGWSNSPQISNDLDYLSQPLTVVGQLRKTLGSAMGDITGDKTPPKPGTPPQPPAFMNMLTSAFNTKNPEQVALGNEYDYAQQLTDLKAKLKSEGVAVPDTDAMKKADKDERKAEIGVEKGNTNSTNYFDFSRFDKTSPKPTAKRPGKTFDFSRVRLDEKKSNVKHKKYKKP